MKIIRVVDAVGNALILQLCFVLCSLPLVTIVPSAVALQRSLEDYRAGERTGLLPYLAQLRVAWRQFWRVGLLVIALGGGAFGAIWFWLSVDSTAGRMALGVLIFWSGLGVSVYLGLLVASTRFPDAGGGLALRQAMAMVRSRPLRALLGLVLVWSWLMLLMTVPTLALVGSGLVPALIARYALDGTPHDQQILHTPAAG